ncbi:MAG: hypothetical protein R6U93_05385 [Dehalococcoidia bacterium]|jgi:hypothetical protein
MDEQKDDIEKTPREKASQAAAHQETTIREKIIQEESVKEKTDRQGNKWRKVYFGGGAHFRNWLAQYQELGFEIETEEVDSIGFRCFEESGEKMHRIWIKEGSR